MRNFIEYVPPLTEGVADDHDNGNSCAGFVGRGYDVYLCTRSNGHAGRHEGAGSANQVYASWEDDGGAIMADMSIRDEERRSVELPPESTEVHFKRLEDENHKLMVERDEARSEVKRLRDLLEH